MNQEEIFNIFIKWFCIIMLTAPILIPLLIIVGTTIGLVGYTFIAML